MPSANSVVHTVWSFSPTSETFVYDYVTGGAALGWTASVLAFERVNAESRPFERFFSARAYAEPLPVRAALGVFDRFSPAWHGRPRVYTRAVRRAVRALRPSVVHAHFGPNGLLVADACAELDVPFVVSFHGYDVGEVVTGRRGGAYRTLFERARAVTVVSNRQRELLVSAGCPEDRLSVIRVGKRPGDWPFRAPSRRVRRFVSVGRLVEKKGHRDVLRAFEALLRNRPELSPTLELIGGGPLEKELREHVAAHDLAPHVTLTGELSHAEVKERMARADAFVLASKTAENGDEEGVPTVLMEALALGLPCVSTRHAGIPEVIPELGQPLLAAEGDVPALAEKLAQVSDLEVPALAELARAGRLKIESEFNLDRELEKLVGLYERLARERSGHA
jgi:colanic acid/amylovoran biosynthesis glycosyltransferase